MLAAAAAFALLLWVFPAQNVKAALQGDDPAVNSVTELTASAWEFGILGENTASEPVGIAGQSIASEPADKPELADTPEPEVSPMPPEEPTVTPPAPLSGWTTLEDGHTRYYLTDGTYVIGMQKIEGKTYLFDDEGYLQKKVWQEFNAGKSYFGSDGARVTGFRVIMGERYFFNSKGIMRTSLWKRINGRKFYFKSNGKAAVGSYKVKGQYYVFNDRGKLLEPKTLKISSLASGKYCVDSKGRPRTGWQMINGKLYYVNASGRIKTNTTYKGIRFTKNGYARDDVNSRLKMEVMKTVDKVTTPGMTKNEKLRACFN